MSQNISGGIVSAPPQAPVAIDLVISQFNQDASLSVIASLLYNDPLTLDASATVDISCDIQIFKNIFQFSIDDLVKLNDPNTNQTDLHFYVVHDAINPLTTFSMDRSSYVSRGAVTTVDARTGVAFTQSEMHISQDYLRYLAKQIFGTYSGVDLIYNETALVADICNNIQSAWRTDYNILYSIDSVSSSLLGPDETGYKYYDNSGSLNNYSNNICRTLFEQMISVDPVRFDTSTNGILDTSAAQPLPFQLGDSISFKFNVQAHPEQVSLLTGGHITDHSYKIKIHLVSSNQNPPIHLLNNNNNNNLVTPVIL